MTRERIPSITSGPKAATSSMSSCACGRICSSPAPSATAQRASTGTRALLRPDEPGFSFERYFELRFDSWELHPATAATAEDQLRARKTIDVLDLNRSGALKSRRRF